MGQEKTRHFDVNKEVYAGMFELFLSSVFTSSATRWSHLLMLSLSQGPRLASQFYYYFKSSPWRTPWWIQSPGFHMRSPSVWRGLRRSQWEKPSAPQSGKQLSWPCTTRWWWAWRTTTHPLLYDLTATCTHPQKEQGILMMSCHNLRAHSSKKWSL